MSSSAITNTTNVHYILPVCTAPARPPAPPSRKRKMSADLESQFSRARLLGHRTICSACVALLQPISHAAQPAALITAVPIRGGEGGGRGRQARSIQIIQFIQITFKFKSQIKHKSHYLSTKQAIYLPRHALITASRRYPRQSLTWRLACGRKDAAKLI